MQDPAPTAEPPLVLDLPPAPADVAPLAATDEAFPLESSVDDALLAWASDRGLAYTDACTRSTPAPGELCDVTTARDTVRLLGPSADEIWYVVTFEERSSLAEGTGYRVARVDIAGRS